MTSKYFIDLSCFIFVILILYNIYTDLLNFYMIIYNYCFKIKNQNTNLHENLNINTLDDANINNNLSNTL